MYSIALEKVDQLRPEIDAIRMEMWNNPEGPYREVIAQRLLSELLEKNGFTVELGYAEVPTSIRATYGSGHPVIGFLAEYDALPGMAQQSTTKKNPIEGQYFGHACGHNLIGAAHASAVIAIKEEMVAKNLPGTIIYYGCPAEEVLTGKVFMARAGAFRELDCSIQFHPGACNATCIGDGASAMNSVKFHFKGTSAHAGGNPHEGRSALDAVELTNVGANYLREHITSDVRVHYTITDGGAAPNIVPDKACVWYYVRAPKREKVEEVYVRLLKVAEGAAMMTETQLEVEFLGGCYNVLFNSVLAETIDTALKNVPMDEWTEEENVFAKVFNDDMPKQYAAGLRAYGEECGTQLASKVIPILNTPGYSSTDVGDVHHIAPGIIFFTACYPLGILRHSWQMSACTGHSIGEKGMTLAARAMAYFGMELLTKPELVEAAKAEFEKVREGQEYVCPIPAEVPVPK